jgi:hypothetical protein
MQKEFDEWFYGSYGGFSCRSEYFHSECEVENVETRRNLLLDWVKTAFEVGFESGYDQGCYEATGGQ